MAESDQSGPSPLAQAILLLRAARSGVLATVRDGQPYASLVTPATAPDRSVLMLFSDLAEHTRQLKAEPRCSLMVTGVAETVNPQTAPRLTVIGRAERIEDAGLKGLWLARHPYAAMYADFGDFALWRLVPERAQLVGGFARAHRLTAEALAPDAAAVAAIAAAADDIMAHCNGDHADAMARIAGGGGAWRMVAVDVDGCDLAQDWGAQGEVVRRVAWSTPVADAMGVRGELVRLARR